MSEITKARGPYSETGLGWPPDEISGRAFGRTRRMRRPDLPATMAPGATLESGLGFRLGRAHRLVREVWEKAIADLELSPPQSALLRAVAERPGSGVRELARRMRTDPMNAKRMADHLERAGLLRSVSDPRHRQRRVLRPTDKGTAVAAELGLRGAAQEDSFAALFGLAHLAQLRGLLESFESALAARTFSEEDAR